MNTGSPPKSLQRGIPSSNHPGESSRRTSRTMPSQMGASGVNAKGQGESTSQGKKRPTPKANDPHRTSASDPRYHAKRRAQVDDAAHDAMLNTVGIAGSPGSVE